jgi:DNA-binding NarL/FixJ family response regulator
VPPALAELTPRELEVLRLIAHGLINADIAAELVTSMATVKTHVNRIFRKLGVAGRAQAVVLAYESGYVTPRGA